MYFVTNLSEVDDDDDEVASVDNEAIAVATLLLSCSFSVLWKVIKYDVIMIQLVRSWYVNTNFTLRTSSLTKEVQ